MDALMRPGKLPQTAGTGVTVPTLTITVEYDGQVQRLSYPTHPEHGLALDGLLRAVQRVEDETTKTGLKSHEVLVRKISYPTGDEPSGLSYAEAVDRLRAGLWP